MLNIVLDTNTLFNPTSLRKLAANPQHVLWGSVLNVIETISDIVDDCSFRKAKAQLRLLREVIGKNLLPDPDQLFRSDAGYHNQNSGGVDMWHLMIDIVLASDSYDECVNGKANPTLGVIHKLNVDVARTWRKTCGEHFVNDTTTMIKSLNRAADCTEQSWNVKMDSASLRALRSFFRYPEAEEMLVHAILVRNGIPSATISRDAFERALSTLAHFTRTYQGYLVKIFEDGIKPRPNDYNDIHLAMPIWRPGWVLVTQETKLREWMQIGGVASSKYATIEELADGAA